MAWLNLTFTVQQILTSPQMTQLQENITQVRTSHIGAGAPNQPAPGVEWWDNSASVWQKRVYDGTDWIPTLFADTGQNEGGASTKGGGVARWGTILTTDVTGNRTEFAGAPFFPKNMLINGVFEFWQRGGSMSVQMLQQKYVADRWFVAVFGGAGGILPSFRVSQSSEAPRATTNLSTSHEIRCNSVKSLLGSGDFMLFEQIVEGYTATRTLYGTPNARYTNLSGWVWSSVTGRISVYVANSSRTANNLKPLDIAAGSTWQFFSLPFIQPTSGAWNIGNEKGIRVGFTLMAHSLWLTSTPAQWLYGPDVRACSGQLHGGSAIGTTFRFAGLQYELGETATPLERLPWTTELNLCQRYFWKSFDQGVAPRFNSGLYSGAISAQADEIGYPTAQIRFAGPMRAIPSIAFFSPFDGTSNWWRQQAAVAGPHANSTQPSPLMLWADSDGASVAFANEQLVIHATADAEMYG